MPTIGASKVESDGARISFRSLTFRRRTPSSPSDFPGEPIQLLSSADMTVNMNVMSGFREAHGLKQWWKQDPALRKNWKTHRIRPSIQYHILVFVKCIFYLLHMILAFGNLLSTPTFSFTWLLFLFWCFYVYICSSNQWLQYINYFFKLYSY